MKNGKFLFPFVTKIRAITEKKISFKLQHCLLYENRLAFHFTKSPFPQSAEKKKFENFFILIFQRFTKINFTISHNIRRFMTRI